MAAKTGSRYLGSTSTLTKAFSQIYFAISGTSPRNPCPPLLTARGQASGLCKFVQRVRIRGELVATSVLSVS
jgi:hypothetical protein